MEDRIEASLYCNGARMLMHLNIKYPNFSVIGGAQILPLALNRISVFSHMVTAMLWRRSGEGLINANYHYYHLCKWSSDTDMQTIQFNLASFEKKSECKGLWN